jgi:hypothetical protein
VQSFTCESNVQTVGVEGLSVGEWALPTLNLRSDLEGERMRYTVCLVEDDWFARATFSAIVWFAVEVGKRAAPVILRPATL